MQYERAGADGENRFALLASRGNKFKQLRVRDFSSGSLATGDKQEVQRWTVCERHVWIDRESLCTKDGFSLLRDHEALWSTSHLVPHRKHFPGADEVEFLDLGEDEYSEGHGERRVVFWDA